MKYGLIGEHLGHSYSKEIHESLADYTYEIKEIAPDDVEQFMLAKDFCGINVTIPYKEKVIPYLDEIDEAARKIGAVNTVVNRDGKLYGYNTDFYGMKSLIERLKVDVTGKKALVLGTGGTSKTANAVLDSLGAKSVITVSRRASEEDKLVTYEQAYELHSDAAIIVNTTPVGMFPKTEGLPIDLRYFTKLEGLVDAVYNPNRTNLVLEAEALKVPAVGGLYMLVMQAVKAAEFFTGTNISIEAGEKIYKKISADKVNVVLIGMPGSGKSSVGHRLAGKLNVPFFDSDALIVEREGREITDIFASDGEAYFRKVESEIIEELALKGSCVISTGGGAILNPYNVKRLKRNGQLMFLDRKPDDIRPTDDRPLGDSQEKIIKLYNERYPKYLAAADHTFNVSGNVWDMVWEIQKVLKGIQ